MFYLLNPGVESGHTQVVCEIGQQFWRQVFLRIIAEILFHLQNLKTCCGIKCLIFFFLHTEERESLMVGIKVDPGH
ncbi:hypothetical protein AGOR_G00139820 [Albula goreensis]|uniref:Uncharacterized protein n=1 Tax=Albula goreensis TaxID=1534307 RepID=A0A8T3D619_9TELE|nr:hypothetical protein AGOR_G00139820 [Albula goreensis]